MGSGPAEENRLFSGGQRYDVNEFRGNGEVTERQLITIWKGLVSLKDAQRGALEESWWGSVGR